MVAELSLLGPGGRRRPLEPEIRRYAKSYRKRLRKLARSSSRLGDLVVSFPAAAFALVSNRGPVDARGAAVRQVKDGAPLKVVANTLELPMWLRRLPPEAFVEPFGEIDTADCPDFDRRIAGLTPEPPRSAAMWFDWLLAALRYGGSDFALWLARQPIYDDAPAPSAAVAPLGAFAWFSGRPDAPASRQLNKQWRRGMAFASAASEAQGWLLRVVSRLCQERGDGGERWTKTHSAGGYRFAPRNTVPLLVAEGRVMDNCVATYWEAVRRGECLIFGVRRGGKAVATLEVRVMRRTRRGFVAQLAGPGNCAVPDKLRKAATDWLKRMGECPLRPYGTLSAGAIAPQRWADVWAPYRAERPVAALFGETPDAEAIRALERGYVALDRIRF